MRDGWVTHKFKDVAIAQKGKLPKEKNDVGEGLPYLTAGYLRTGKPDFWIENPESALIAQEGDCLILWDGAGAGDLFRSKDGVVSSTMARVTPIKDDVNREFLTLLVSSKASYIKETCRGTTVPHVSPDAMENMELRIPTIENQVRIVDLISSVDNYIDALELQLCAIRDSRIAVSRDLLVAAENDWAETTLGEVAKLNPEVLKDLQSDRMIRYVDLSSVHFDSGIDKDIEPMSISKAPGRARRIVRENDILVSTVRPYLKGFAIVEAEFDGEVASTGFCVIRSIPGVLSPFFAWTIVTSEAFIEHLVRRSTGSSYPAVRPSDVSDFPLSLPSYKHQEAIGNLMRQMDLVARNITLALTATRKLRASLLQNLLSGEHEIPTSYDALKEG